MCDHLGTWALVELADHRLLAGLVTETRIAGHGFIRVDMYGGTPEPPSTKYVSPSAIQAISPTSEEAARAVAEAVFRAWTSPYDHQESVPRAAVDSCPSRERSPARSRD